MTDNAHNSGIAPRSLSPSEKIRGQRLAILASLPGILHYLSLGPLTTNFFTAIRMTPLQVGLLGSLMNLTGYAQLVTSIIAEHFGRKRVFLVFTGLALVIAVAAPFLPLIALWSGNTRAIFWTMVVFIAISVCQNLGMATWFAMMKDFADPGTRGAFFSRMRLIWGSVSLAYFLIIWLIFRGGDQNISLWGFTVIFTLGLVCGWIRYFIVRKFPVVEMPPTAGILPSFRAALRETFDSRLFRQHLFFYGAFAFVAGLVDPFVVLYIKYQLQLTDTVVNLVRVFWQLGGLLGLWLIGLCLDRVGPRVVYIWTASVAVAAMWLLILPSPGWSRLTGVICVILAVRGFSEFGFGLANTDSLLFSVGDRNPALAIVIATVVNLTTSSLAQLLSGKILTAFSGWQWQGVVEMNIYKIMFLTAGGLMLMLIALRCAIRPPPKNEAQNMTKDQ